MLDDAKSNMKAYFKDIGYEDNEGSDAMKRGFKTVKENVEEEEKEAHDNDSF